MWFRVRLRPAMGNTYLFVTPVPACTSDSVNTLIPV